MPVLTVLTSKSRSRAGVVQILSRSTSKSAPGLPVFNDFDFQIALARRRGANFVDILGNRSFATSVFRTYLCELSKRQNYGKTQHFAQFLPAKTSLLSNIDAARATGNFQYSRKLELLNFLWSYYLQALGFSGDQPHHTCKGPCACVDFDTAGRSVHCTYVGRKNAQDTISTQSNWGGLGGRHASDAPLEDLLLPLNICRWTCTGCSAGGSTLAVEHVLDAPLEDLRLPLNMYLMLRLGIYSLRLHMYLMLRWRIYSCRWTCTWCSAGGPTLDKIESRNVLRAHYLNKEPGLLRVLRALKMHREKAAAGLISPGNCFKKPLWDFWRLRHQKTWLSSCASSSKLPKNHTIAYDCHDLEPLCWFCPTPTSIFACSWTGQKQTRRKFDDPSSSFNDW